ncbi:MAG: hypothetical protein PVH12_03155 [Candidatus Bathyarchaeota archaeon]|jgi:hypothetical protein
MNNARIIEIQKPKVIHGKILKFDIAYSKPISRFFSSNKLYVEYEEDIGDLDPSILCIPAVSGVIALAWATGADLHIETLDQTYLKSLNKIKPLMMRLYPNFSFSTQIHVEDVVSNNLQNNGYGLLFTGGIDSITSYIKHKEKMPNLIKIWGAEVAFNDEKNWRKIQKILTDFADGEGVKLHVIRTNIPRVLKKHILYQDFEMDWWLNVSHGFVLPGSCAPLTCAEGIGTLYFASGDPREDWRSKYWSSLLNTITWADVEVILDNYEVSRQLKIKYFLKDYIKSNSPIFLKVCNVLPTSNCGKCEKCLRAIIGLIAEGIDPNKCGFNNVDSRTFDLVKKSFVKKTLLSRKRIVERKSDIEDRIAMIYFWEDIQKHIPKVIENDLQGSKEFLEWFRNFNITEYIQEVQKNTRIPLHYFMYMLILDIIARLPKSTQNPARQLLDFIVKI